MNRSLFRRLLALGLCLLALAPALTASVRAEGVYVSFSDPGASPGETFTITVRASVPLSRLSLQLSYDEAYLRYESAEGGLGAAAVSAAGGVVNIEDYAAADGDFGMKLRFTALKLGRTELRVVSCSVSLADGSAPEAAWGYSAVTITTEESDTSLRSLALEQAFISPTFSPDVFEYTAEVPNAVRWVAVNAQTNSALSTALIAGHESLRQGENRVSVTVTAKDGSEQVYTITVRRLEPAPEPTPSPEPTPEPTPEATPAPTPPPLTLTAPDGSELAIGSFTYLQVPEGFHIIEFTFRDQAVAAIEKNGRTAVWLPGNAANAAGFYYLDVEDGSASPIDGFRTADQSYRLLDAALSAMAPAGEYRLAEYDFNGVSCRAFIPKAADAGYVIFYGRVLGGRQGLYLYDTAGGGVVRYGLVPEEAETEQEIEEAIPYTNAPVITADEAVFAAQQEADAMRRAAEIACVVAAALLFAVLALVWALVKARMKK